MVAEIANIEVRYTLQYEDAASAFEECVTVNNKRIPAVKLSGRAHSQSQALCVGVMLAIFAISYAMGIVWPIAAFAGIAGAIPLLAAGFGVSYMILRHARRKAFIAQAGGWETWKSDSYVGINADGVYKHSLRTMQTFFWNHVANVVLNEKI